MARSESRLVAASRLETEFLADCIKHKLRKSGSSQLPEIEEIWDVESTIGKGTFGIVRIERCRVLSTHSSPPTASRVRAVKEISKSVAAGQRWDYMKELEAIARFSSTNAQPEFSEDATQQIVRQLLKGIRFMHSSNFAHRDLKPGNILVAAYSPRWVVKIADFGISKEFMEGGTNLRTHIGTLGYMAPEVLGASNSANSYSVSVDIWAIGIIAIELLMKQHPLPTVSDLFDLFHGRSILVTDTERGLFLSEVCRDFIRGLLNTDPITRPTASVALLHEWLEEVIPDSDDEESLFVRDDRFPRNLSQEQHGATPISLPSLAWSNLQLTNNTSASQTTNTLLNTYSGPTLDSRLLLPSLQGFLLEANKYFVLRSDNPIDIETSVAHNVWTSSSRVNKILEKAWKKTDGQVILFFSVIGSQRFCGIAQMTSGMDWVNTDEHWLEDSWKGRFTLNWLCLTELPFAGVKHVPVKSTTPGFRAIACYDGTEISASSAFELLKAYTAREREEASQLASPPATATPMDIDTVPPSSSLAGEHQRSASSLTSQHMMRDQEQRITHQLGFNDILRPHR
ncbi:hypothetical protein EKO27_g4887 [Xylaria grammica]|uniref:Protein kinase domain-containing protein n=1 Tax=Xylaria grammica TaxID=363999 RepID=A0A439D756_9PEZI|nr:hypothetical protein EKO27_g4887 [Xylaria grammica]